MSRSIMNHPPTAPNEFRVVAAKARIGDLAGKARAGMVTVAEIEVGVRRAAEELSEVDCHRMATRLGIRHTRAGKAVTLLAVEKWLMSQRRQ